MAGLGNGGQIEWHVVIGAPHEGVHSCPAGRSYSDIIPLWHGIRNARGLARANRPFVVSETVESTFPPVFL